MTRLPKYRIMYLKYTCSCIGEAQIEPFEHLGVKGLTLECEQWRIDAFGEGTGHFLECGHRVGNGSRQAH